MPQYFEKSPRRAYWRAAWGQVRETGEEAGGKEEGRWEERGRGEEERRECGRNVMYENERSVWRCSLVRR